MVASIDDARAAAVTRERITILFDGFYAADDFESPVREFVGALWRAHGTPEAAEARSG